MARTHIGGRRGRGRATCPHQGTRRTTRGRDPARRLGRLKWPVGCASEVQVHVRPSTHAAGLVMLIEAGAPRVAAPAPRARQRGSPPQAPDPAPAAARCPPPSRRKAAR
eukprot:scaffold3807_cov62-Phaeocystis_antarctica.AAC.3